MPLYDYRCTGCEQTFELLTGLNEQPDCPNCGTVRMERCVSLTAPAGKTAGMLNRARNQAAREGHFSHYAPSERPK